MTRLAPSLKLRVPLFVRVEIDASGESTVMVVPEAIVISVPLGQGSASSVESGRRRAVRAIMVRAFFFI